jgi:hypothetical protein
MSSVKELLRVELIKFKFMLAFVIGLSLCVPMTATLICTFTGDFPGIGITLYSLIFVILGFYLMRLGVKGLLSRRLSKPPV